MCINKEFQENSFGLEKNSWHPVVSNQEPTDELVPTENQVSTHRLDSSAFLSKDNPIFLHGDRLPHWDQMGKYVFCTFRLSDSLPKEKREELNAQIQYWLTRHPEPWDEAAEREYHTLFSHRLDKWLDNGYGGCILRNYEAAKIVEDTLSYEDGTAYELVDYVVMPNHVHILIKPNIGINIDTLIQKWKSVSSHKLSKTYGQEWCGWMKKYHDRHIRNESHYYKVLEYIYKNYCSGGVVKFL